MTAAAPLARDGSEAELCARWGHGLRGPLRLADGRALRIVFPGVPGGGAGPDFRGAILDAGGDLLRGDVEVHLRASGWFGHGHQRDPAYGAVVLHLVGLNDSGALVTHHASGRAIPILVAPGAEQEAFPPPFLPPCVLRRGETLPVLERMGRRRLRAKAARIGPLIAASGRGQALYTLLLETLGGTANRAAFAALARRLPLAALQERAGTAGQERALAMTAELKGAAMVLAVRRAGLRPMASPARRLEAAGALFARLWPGDGPGGPARDEGTRLPGWQSLRVAGVGRAMAIELFVNAVLPVALASGTATEDEAFAELRALPSPGTYGKLRSLEGWLGGGEARPFASAAALQGGLLLHADYCTKGACGRCPLSEK